MYLGHFWGIKSVVFHDFSYICLEFLGDMGVDLGCCLSISMAHTIHNSFQRNSIFCQATDQGVAEDVTGQIFLDWFIQPFICFLECQVERVGLHCEMLFCDSAICTSLYRLLMCLPIRSYANGYAEDYVQLLAKISRNQI